MKISYNTNEFLFDFPFYQQTKLLLSFIFLPQKHQQHEPQTNQKYHDQLFNIDLMIFSTKQYIIPCFITRVSILRHTF